MTNKFRITIALVPALVAFTPPIASANANQSWTVQSPDRGLTVEVEQNATDRMLTYRIGATDNTVIHPSQLGVMMPGAGGDFTHDLSFVAASTRAILEAYEQPTGKRRVRRNEGQELALSFKNIRNTRFQIVFRVFNDGVGFRYVFSGKGKRKITEELTQFRVDGESTGWLHPYDPDYEKSYPKTSMLAAPAQVGFPALFKTSSTWALISEAAVFGDYAAAHLKRSGDPGSFTIAFPQASIESRLPWSTPWRVVLVGRNHSSGLKTIVESTLVDDLNPGNEIGNTDWIRPGPSTFPWWSDNTANTERTRIQPFADLAAAMDWTWIEFDTGLITDPYPPKYIATDDWMKLAWPGEFVGDAKKRGLHVYAWDHWKNLDTPAKRARYFTHLNKLGIEGIKIDFMDGDLQTTMQWYDDTSRDCAKYKLMVSFHGATIPRGQQRRWPHVMTWEAVMGAEFYQLRDQKNIPTPEHNTTLPFTRNVVGPMDFTGVTFSEARRTTSSAHELALSVVFESAWQNFSDLPQSYLGSVGRPFLQAIPAAWDETRLIAGAPGEFVAMARRKQNVWYVGVIAAGPARTLTLPMEFLGPGPMTVVLYQDDDQGKLVAKPTTISSGAVWKLPIRANGGAAFRIELKGNLK
jgi:alpha-glucosidase